MAAWGAGRDARLSFHDRFSAILDRARRRRRLFGTLLSLTSVNVLVAGLSLLTTVAIANHLGKATFGEFSYAMALGAYVAVIAMCGLDRTLVRDLVHRPDRLSRQVAASVLVRAGLFVLLLVSVVAVNLLVPAGARLSLGAVVLIAAVGIKSLDLAAVYDAQDRTDRHTVWTVCERGLYFALVWAAILAFSEIVSVAFLGVCLLVASAVGLGVQYRSARGSIDFRVDREILAEALQLARRNRLIWIAAVAGLSFGGLSRVLLKHLAGNEELGAFSVAWLLVALATLPLAQITRVGQPRVARLTLPGVPVARKSRALILYAGVALLVASGVGLPAILFPEEILRVFFRPEYASSAGALRVLGGYVMLLGVGMVASQYLVTAGRESAYSGTVILSGALSLLLYSALIPRWSAYGAALAVLLAHGFAMLVYVATAVVDLRGLADRERLAEEVPP